MVSFNPSRPADAVGAKKSRLGSLLRKNVMVSAVGAF